MAAATAALIVAVGCATQTQQKQPSPVNQSVTTTAPADNPFHDYDAAVSQAVRNKWNSYFGWASRVFWPNGDVTVSFQLYDDGTVHSLDLVKTSGSMKLDLLAFRAVDESAPFAPLPEELRKLTENKPRSVSFTFHY